MKEVKVVVLGDKGVGKTALLSIYRDGSYDENKLPNVLENFTLESRVDNEKFKAEIYDTTFSSHSPELLKGLIGEADCFLLCYSLADPTSATNAVSHWFFQITSFAKKRNLPIIACGTKQDLAGENSPPTTDVAKIIGGGVEGFKVSAQEENSSQTSEPNGIQLVMATCFARALEFMKQH